VGVRGGVEEAVEIETHCKAPPEVMCPWVGGGNAIEDLDAEGGLGDGSEERLDDFLTL